MDKNDNYIRIPRQKLNFYKRIRVDKDIHKLIKLINYLQKWSQSYDRNPES